MSQVVLGTWPLSGDFGPVDLVQVEKTLNAAFDEGFVEFIHEFDPNYQIPSDKIIQQLLAEAYNQIRAVLIKIFDENIIFCSITTDL